MQFLRFDPNRCRLYISVAQWRQVPTSKRKCHSHPRWCGRYFNSKAWTNGHPQIFLSLYSSRWASKSHHSPRSVFCSSIILPVLFDRCSLTRPHAPNPTASIFRAESTMCCCISTNGSHGKPSIYSSNKKPPVSIWPLVRIDTPNSFHYSAHLLGKRFSLYAAHTGHAACTKIKRMEKDERWGKKATQTLHPSISKCPQYLGSVTYSSFT